MLTKRTLATTLALLTLASGAVQGVTSVAASAHTASTVSAPSGLPNGPFKRIVRRTRPDVNAVRQTPASTNPFDGRRLWVAPRSEVAAARAADAARTTDPARAQALDLLAAQPTAYWFGDWNPVETVRAEVAQRTSRIGRAGALPLYVIYNIMKRDQGTGYARGGVATLAEYRRWIDEVAAGLGTTRSAIVLEPDAVNDLYHMVGQERADRVEALKYAIGRLQANGSSVYLDGGTFGIHGVPMAAQLLKEAGVSAARGFSLNVANFQADADVVAYGRQVSAALGGKPFVIDTGRNGNGAISAEVDREYWCNPPGRAIGKLPTLAPAVAGVDAFLWIKTPGESDGECRGFPAGGTFVEDYAYELVVARR